MPCGMEQARPAVSAWISALICIDAGLRFDTIFILIINCIKLAYYPDACACNKPEPHACSYGDANF